ncbi:polymeric immunoglobulin receptor-like [Hoplias malabaricus]|uniref:polymeric immunoglobulin receptor-like n=1 Tax=Hoplias malabaricus TaxID=27720 RepID=UPI0034632029
MRSFSLIFLILLLLLSVVSGGIMLHEEITETGTEGRAAVIHCPYTEGYETYVKYFCKGVYKHCTTLMQTNREVNQTYKGRFTLTDNKDERQIVVTISDLRMEDTGLYGCGIEKVGHDPFTVVHLTVNKVLSDSMLYEEVKETGTMGSAAVIHCPYTEGYETYIKYFCKRVYKNCTTLLQTNGEDSWRHEGRLSLTDDKEQRLIVVTIRDLRMEDTGPYGCGIERTGQDLFTLVHLTVNKAPRTSTDHTTTVTHKTQVLNLSVLIPLCALLLFAGVFLFFYHRRKKRNINSLSANYYITGRMTTGAVRDEMEYESDPPGNQVSMNPVYQSLNTSQLDSIYQGLNPTTNQSNHVF